MLLCQLILSRALVVWLSCSTGCVLEPGVDLALPAGTLAVSAPAEAGGLQSPSAPRAPAELPAVSALRQREVQANIFTASTQNGIAIDQDALGRIVAVWQSRRQEDFLPGVYARQFDAAGRPLGGEVHVNAWSPNPQSSPAVALDARGLAWFAWESFHEDGDQGSIVARRFDAALQPLTGDIIVNDEAAGHQAEVALAGTAAGAAIVAWTTPGPANAANRCVRLRHLAAGGMPLGPSIVVDDPGPAIDRRPQVGADAEGRFTVVWARTRLDGWPLAILARRFNAAGEPLGSAFTVSTSESGRPVEPALAVGADGSWSVAWASGHGDGYGIELRHFTADGTPVSLPMRIDQDAGANTRGLTLARADNGCTAVVWGDYQSDSGKTRLLGRLFDPQGLPAGEIFPATGCSTGNQRLAVSSGGRRLVLHDDGRMVLAWSGDGGGEDDSAAHVTLGFPPDVDLAAPSAPAVAPPAATAEAAASPHQPPAFDAGATLPTRAQILAGEETGGATGFLGIIYNGWNPPDPSIAVGPGHVLIVGNGTIAAFTKDGVQVFEDQLQDAAGFWGEVGATVMVFDPEVLYDPLSNRFFAVANERGPLTTPYLLLAVTAGSDPAGKWHKYRFNVDEDAAFDFDIDSPNIAVDDQAVYMTADFFGPDKYLIYAVDKAAVLEGAADPATNSLLLINEQSWGLAVSYDDPPAQYTIEAGLGFAETTVILRAITDPFGSMNIDEHVLTVPAYQFPEDPPSQGTTERPELFEARFWSCMYRNGTLWATHHINSSRVRQRWYQIAMNDWPAGGTPELVQWGEVDPGTPVRTFFGSIWADEQNNMALTFARSSPTELISMNWAFRLAGDPPGETRPMILIRESTSPLPMGPEQDRWGDYSGVVTDPVQAGLFWMHHEYQAAAGWRTWVASGELPFTLAVDVELAPAMLPGSAEEPITRCLEFEVFDCDAGEGFTTTADVVIGAPGHPAGLGHVVLELPGGNWTCVSAQDPKHSLRSSCPITCDAGGCTASITGEPQDSDCHWLMQGNLNGDDAIDVSDLALMNTNYLKTVPLASECGGGTVHADVNGDGISSMADLLFLAAHFLEVSEQTCADLCDGPSPALPPEPLLAVPVETLDQMGYGPAAYEADIDGDGAVDFSELRPLLGRLPGGGDDGEKPAVEPETRPRKSRGTRHKN
jgi:hypothetical protein